jgi:hypothetical protein
LKIATLLIISLHRYYDPLTRKSWANTVAVQCRLKCLLPGKALRQTKELYIERECIIARHANRVRVMMSTWQTTWIWHVTAAVIPAAVTAAAVCHHASTSSIPATIVHRVPGDL